MSDYKLIQTLETPDGRTANAVVTNNEGHWLAEFYYQDDEQVAMPLSDDNGDYIPAPADWHQFAIEI